MKRYLYPGRNSKFYTILEDGADGTHKNHYLGFSTKNEAHRIRIDEDTYRALLVFAARVRIRNG